MKAIILVFLTALFINAQTDHWRLLWDKNLDSDFPNNSGQYHIYRSVGIPIPITYAGDPIMSLDYIPRAGYVDTTMQWIDSALPKGQQIYYRLKAENQYGISEFSEQVSSEIPLLIGDTLTAVNTMSSFQLSVASELFSANLHLWQASSGNPNITVAIDNTGKLDVTFPWGWSGEAPITIVVSNPDEMFDQKDYIFKVEAVYPSNVGKPTLEVVQPVPDLGE